MKERIGGLVWVNFDVGKYRAMVNSKGDIIAYENTAQHRRVDAHINDKTNLFLHTDKDRIITAGRKLFNKVYGGDERYE